MAARMTTASGSGGGTGAGAPGGSSDGAAPGPAKRGGPPGWFIVLAVGSLVAGMVLVLLPMLGIGMRVGSAPASIPPTTAAADRTYTQVARALGAASIQVQDPRTQYRPGESPSLAVAPRRLVQAILPDDPQNGYVVIYELASATAAEEAGREMLAFVSKGPGTVSFPRDSQFVVQRIGPTLVFFTWSPQVSPTGGAAAVAAALTTVGEPVRP
jgi:hypothetical protein